ncbi:MAG: hypothetical protein J0M36_05165 [Caulobacterales bacterium]|nr:hypothetical protein [Caulobacterales bacterium]
MKTVLARYYLTLVGGFLLFILFGFTPLGYRIVGGLYVFVWIIMLLAFYAALWRFKCPRCGSSIVRRYIAFGDRKLWGVSLLPGTRCPSCGLEE